MKIEFTDLKEQDDGSAIANVEVDEEFIEEAVNFYIIHIIKEHIKDNNMEDEVKVTPCDNYCCGGKNCKE